MTKISPSPAGAHARLALRRLNKLLICCAFFAFLASASAVTVTWTAAGGTAWLTDTNWGGTVPGAADVAQFATNPTTATGITITMSGATNNGPANQAVGAIEISSARTTGAVTISNNATATDGTLTLNGATVNGVNDVILRNASTVNSTLQNGTSRLAIALADATDNVVVLDNSGNFTISANISGASKHVTVSGGGSGDFILSGTNTFDGGITINGAKLRLSNAVALPASGALAVNNNGRLRFNASGTFGGSGQTLTLTPSGTASAAIDIQSGAPSVVFLGNVILNADSRIEVNSAASTMEFSGALSGSGTLLKQATGTLILSGTATNATGGTQIGNGAVTVTANSSLGTGALAMASSGANNTTLNLNNAAQTVGNLSSSFIITTGTQAQTINLNGTALTLVQTGTTSYGPGAVASLTSTISGSGSLILSQSSTGMLTLTGSNSYSGGTTVNGGALVINGSVTSAVNVNGGTVGGSGAVGGLLTVTGTGTVSPGTSPGKLTLQTGLNLAGGGSYLWQLGTLTDDTTGAAGTDFDQISLTGGNLTLGGSSKLTLDFSLLASGPGSANPFWQSNHDWTIVSGSGASNAGSTNFSVINNSTFANGTFATAADSAGKVTLTYQAVPEPSTFIGLAIGAGILLAGWRRHKSRAS